MKILRIGGRNLASLAGDFAVDFEAPPLAASGLFAISGPTGAGKSTLLDALCLALYGATPRLKTARAGALVPDAGGDAIAAQDPRSLLRRGAGEGHAEVDFVGNDGQRYRAQWSVRRAFKRASGALQPSAMSLHRLPEMAAIGGKRTETAGEIEKRIGLTFDQFTRAVLLAQNEFAAFLRTDENDRGELLETLTGSTIYSVLSRRAYERYRQEQDALRLLTARLADQAPCSVEERAVLDADSARADGVLAELDARQQGYEQLLRWQQAATVLADGVALAEAALAAAHADVDGALERRRHLALLAAVETARPLHADLLRARQQQAALAQAVTATQAAMAQAQAGEQEAGQAAAQAAVLLAGAEAALQDATPHLDAAKALDAAIAALAPAHAQAQAAHAHAVREAAQAASQAQAAGAALASAQQAQADAASWLQQHAALAPLAAQWPRWDKLLLQAGALQAQSLTLAAALQQAQQQARTSAAAAASAQAALADAAAQLQLAAGARADAAAALAAFDGGALRRQRSDLGEQRQQVEQARAVWQRRSEQAVRADAVQGQLAQARAQAAAAEGSAAAAAAAAPALAGALQQADSALLGAELACAEKVEDLRAQLADDAPCPVCGATDHPYADASPALHAVLASLREQLRACRDAADANLARLAGARAQAADAQRQANELAERSAALAVETSALQAQWRAVALSGVLEQEAAAYSEVQAQADQAAPADGVLRACALRLQALDTALHALDASENRAALALAARDAAQAAFEQAGKAHAGAIDAAASERLAASSAAGALAALADKAAAAGTELQVLLADLDAAFAAGAAKAAVIQPAPAHDLFAAPAAIEAVASSHPGDAGDPGDPGAPIDADGSDNWRARWLRDPDAFRHDCARQAARYNQCAQAEPARQAALAAAGERNAASQASAAQAAALAARTAMEHARHASDIGARRTQRAALFDGEDAGAVQARLASAVTRARELLAARQGEAQAARVQAARAADQLLQLQARLADNGHQQLRAEQALASWLADFPRQHPSLGAAPPETLLAQLLATPAPARDAEQQAVQAIDADATAAATVLAERRAQQARHAGQPPAGYSPEASASLASDMAQLAADRKAAAETAAALRARLAEDSVRRRNAEDALASIERQQLSERRWGRLSELIGSADGKKFRNYAQQFTLDVLLGYANAHLAQLAKRYRLERVASGAGPSLGLMVRDQDMGDEARGVNSLSGGESFLVSLALALGLASLSSNRVKVESLFIDEGFGSLDSETLRVAMDALDGLQAMGRKVGVISHVQEMTERIATRIVVAPAGAGSSSVTVE